MSRTKMESESDLARLEQLVSQAGRRLRKVRDCARDVSGRLAEQKGSPDGDQEGEYGEAGWRR